MPNRFITLGLFSLIVAVFSAGAVFAGFEWVPPPAAPEKTAGQADPMLTPAPAPAGVLAPLEPVTAQPLPPASPTPPPAPVAAAPAPAAPVIVRAAVPPPAPAAPLLKIKTVTAPEPAPKAPPTPTPAPQILWNPSVAPAAPASQQTIKKLVINPYPQKTATSLKPSAPAAMPKPVVAAEPAPDSAYSPVVGFGSDMPLALALQQIAPAGYIFTFGDNVNPGTNISWDGGGKPWNKVIAQALDPLGLEARIDGKTVHIKNGLEAAEKHSAMIMPEAGDDSSLTDGDLRRGNVTDPGETPKKQPLSMPVLASAEEADTPDDAIPLLPAEMTADIVTEAAVESAPAAAPVVVRGLWEVRQGDSLKETFDAWSKKANVELVWNATHDYTVESDMTLNDSFQVAVQAVIAHGIKQDKPEIKIEDESKSGKAGTLIVQDQS